MKCFLVSMVRRSVLYTVTLSRHIGPVLKMPEDSMTMITTIEKIKNGPMTTIRKIKMTMTTTTTIKKIKTNCLTTIK